MAIKHPIHSIPNTTEADIDSKRVTPIVLSASETKDLLQSLHAAPQPLSLEVQNAIANYKRIKAKPLPK